MKTIVEWCKGHHKRLIALGVAFVMICTTLWIPEENNTVHAQETEVAFESLYHTVQKGSVTVEQGTDVKLGQVSSIDKGFAFTLTNPSEESNGDHIKIGLFNTNSANVWQDGYILHFETKGEQGTLGWAVRKGAGETAFDFDTLQGLEGDKIEIRAWLSNINSETGAHTINIHVNGQELWSGSNDGTSVSTGCFFGVYSGWSKAEIKAAQTNDVPNEGVIFDNLGANSISASKGSTLDIGKVASTDRGFQFKVTKFTDGEMKIGLFNQNKNVGPWDTTEDIIFGYSRIVIRATANGLCVEVWMVLL